MSQVGQRVLVVVALVRGVGVTFVDIVGVALALHAGMAAAGPVVVLMSGVNLVLSRRLTQLGFDLLTVVATLLVTSYILFGGGTQALFPLLYVWVAAYAAYVYPARRVALHTGLMVAAYGLVILFGHGRSIDAASWVVTAGTVVAVSGLILLLRTLAEGLATRVTFDLPFSILQRELDDVVTLTEEELASGIRLAGQVVTGVVEGAGTRTVVVEIGEVTIDLGDGAPQTGPEASAPASSFDPDDFIEWQRNREDRLGIVPVPATCATAVRSACSEPSMSPGGMCTSPASRTCSRCSGSTRKARCGRLPSCGR